MKKVLKLIIFILLSSELVPLIFVEMFRVCRTEVIGKPF